MPTTQQLIRKGRKRRKHKTRRSTPELDGQPQMRGSVTRAFITKPKKPNSGWRKLCRVRLVNGKSITAHIPGEAHNIQEHSQVVVRGGRIKDVPGIRFRVVRGSLDASPVADRRQARSHYGTSKPDKE